MSDDKRTVIEEGTRLTGAIESTVPVLVRGRVQGEVETPSLTVSNTGGVAGKAKVGALVSEGELSGQFDADTVQLSGSVKDGTAIRAKSIEVKLAADGKMQMSFGETELQVGDSPTDEQGNRKKKRD